MVFRRSIAMDSGTLAKTLGAHAVSVAPEVAGLEELSALMEALSPIRPYVFRHPKHAWELVPVEGIIIVSFVDDIIVLLLLIGERALLLCLYGVVVLVIVVDRILAVVLSNCQTPLLLIYIFGLFCCHCNNHCL